MREDLPSAELQNLYPAPSDGEVSPRWARSINRACTEWLLARGLSEPAAKDWSPVKIAPGAIVDAATTPSIAETVGGEETP